MKLQKGHYMYDRIVYSEELFTKQIAMNAKKYRMAGLLSIIFIIGTGILNRLGIQLKEIIPTVLGNILAALALAALFSWLFHSLFLLSKRQQARESYISSNGYSLTYHVLKSRDTIGRIREVYHTWHVTRIEKIVETASYYIVYGDMELTEKINRGEHSKRMNMVKIPKYYNGLSELLERYVSNNENLD